LNVKINLVQKDYQTALKLISNILKLDNSCADAYKYKSIIYSVQGLKQRAIEAAKIAVTLRPQDSLYYAHLAKLYFDTEEYSDAFLYYKEASIIDELNSDYLYLAAKSADKADDFSNANNYYSYALRLQPFNNLIIYEYRKKNE
jgi:tetratricopeptide (TPR) repeat protein